MRLTLSFGFGRSSIDSRTNELIGKGRDGCLEGILIVDDAFVANLRHDLAVTGTEPIKQLRFETRHILDLKLVKVAAGTRVDRNSLLINGIRRVDTLLEQFSEAIAAL